MHVKTRPSTPDDDEYKLILQNVDRLDVVLRQTARERAGWLKRANALRCSTRALPNEILATIFMFAAPPIDFSTRPFYEADDDGTENDYDIEDGDDYEDDGEDDSSGNGDGNEDDSEYGVNSQGGWPVWPVDSKEEEDLECQYFPLVLSAVSSRWRQVAMSTPRLWTTLVLEVRCGQIEKQADFLRHYLQNSKGLFFCLDLNFRSHAEQLDRLRKRPRQAYSHPNHTSLDPIEDVVLALEFRERFQTLRLVQPPENWIVHAPLFFPKITNLAIGWGHLKGIPMRDIPFSPSLQRIMFLRAQLTIPETLCNLTTIHLRKISIDRGIDFLLRLSQLIEFHNYDPVPPVLPLTQLKPFTHPNIRILGWTWREHLAEYHNEVLKHFRFPNIRRLIWERRCGEENAYTMDFIRSLPRTFLSLDLSRMAGDACDPRLYAIFTRLDHIEELTLVKCTPLFIYRLFLVMHHGSTPVPFLPNLKTLCIRDPVSRETLGVCTGDDSYLKLAWEFLSLRGQLLKVSGPRVQLIGCRLGCDEESSKILQEFVQSGIRVEIVEGSEAVPRL